MKRKYLKFQVVKTQPLPLSLLMRKNSNMGFTFIELLVVISILITILGLAVPSIINYQKKQAESEEIKNFVSLFRTTQNLALTTDTTYSMSFQNGDISTCPANSTECKTITSDYIRSTSSIIYLDRYGNLVDINNMLISSSEVLLSSPSYNLKINKFGRIYVQNR